MRYEIFAGEDFYRDTALEAKTPRGALTAAKQLIKTQELDYVIVTDNKYGMVMTLYLKGPTLTIALRCHDYHWQTPELGLVTKAEAEVFQGRGSPTARRSLLAKRQQAERLSLRDLTNACILQGLTVSHGTNIKF